VVLAALPLGLAIGLAVGMLGGGGSVLAVPVLVYVLGQDVHEATTASLVIVTAGALAGGLGHARTRSVCWSHAAWFVAAALPGVVAGTAAGDAVGGSALIGGFAGLMLVAALATWRRSGTPDEEGGDGPAACPPLRRQRDVALGFAVGALTGFFGIGGGFVVVPALAVLLTLSMRLAVGTSLVIIACTSLLGLLAHLVAGRTIDVPVTVAMAAGCAVGALGGGLLAAGVSQRVLGRAFALLVAVVAAYLLISVAFLGGPPAA
jgi:uncharacterized membrane protein YfcA